MAGIICGSESRSKASSGAHYDQGGSLSTASALAGVSRSTGYRWLEAQFTALRDSGMSRAAAARQLRLSRGRSERWELERRQYRRDVAGERVKAERHAIRDSGRHVQLLELPRRPSPRQVRLAGLEQRYWELMRAGVSNTEACRLLGMHRQAGTRIRKRSHHQTLRPMRPTTLDSGRYLSLRERLQIADLERLGYSIRKIANELGRHPSTVKRELDRNRDQHGRYLPHGADDAARLRRRRPRAYKLMASPRLRMLVQRKLNRYWSRGRDLRMAPPDVPRRRLHATVCRNDLPGATAAQRARPGYALLLIASYRAKDPQVPLADSQRCRRSRDEHDDDRQTPRRGR